MGVTDLVRWGAIALMLGGVVWLVLGLSTLFGYLQAIEGIGPLPAVVAAPWLCLSPRRLHRRGSRQEASRRCGTAPL